MGCSLAIKMQEMTECSLCSIIMIIYFLFVLQFWEESPEIYGIRRSGRARKEPERLNVMLEVHP